MLTKSTSEKVWTRIRALTMAAEKTYIGTAVKIVIALYTLM